MPINLVRFKNDAIRILKKIKKIHLMVIGDIIIDESICGVAERISREAPVLILKYDDSFIVPGGAGNAANNAADLGANVFLISVIGEDVIGSKLIQYFHKKNISTQGIIKESSRLTPVKTRILAGAIHSAKQQVIRIDRVSNHALLKNTEAKLIRQIKKMAPWADALLISDYQLQTVSEPIRQTLLKIFQGKPIVVDSRHQLSKYMGATVVTPNLEEAMEASNLLMTTSTDCLQIGKGLTQKLQCKVLITQGPNGMSIFDQKSAACHLPIYNTDQPIDPTGAGDTVASMVSLVLATGADLFMAAALATIAAGMVVNKRGTATISMNEMEKSFQNFNLLNKFLKGIQWQKLF
jgi:rfaE bifunctional protein kinase chain/domain